MSVDWRRMSRSAGLRVKGDGIEVRFSDGRRQLVVVEENDADGDALRLWSLVAKPAALSALKKPLTEAWTRNRLSEFIGFTIDSRGRMIGESWVPVSGLSSDEWGFHVRQTAQACDRFEYLLTGSDVE